MNWPWTPLRDVLQRAPAPVTLLEQVVYQQATVQPYPRGVVLKAVKSGFDFPNKHKKLIHSGQFIISKMRSQRRIWGMVPRALDGAVVSQHYLVFDLRSGLHPDYFAAYLSTPLFRQAAAGACSWQGRLRLQPFADITFPLPSWEDQCQVVEFWKQANLALEHTREMYRSISETRSGVAGQLFQNANSGWEHKTLGECATIGQAVSNPSAVYLKPPDDMTLDIPLMGDNALCIVPYPDLDRLFLYYYLESQKPLLRSTLGGLKSGVDETIGRFPLSLPTLYEQRKISTVMEQHDEVLLRLRVEQAALRRLVEGMLHGIFSGTLNLQEAMPMLRNL